MTLPELKGAVILRRMTLPELKGAVILRRMTLPELKGVLLLSGGGSCDRSGRRRGRGWARRVEVAEVVGRADWGCWVGRFVKRCGCWVGRFVTGWRCWVGRFVKRCRCWVERFVKRCRCWVERFVKRCRCWVGRFVKRGGCWRKAVEECGRRDSVWAGRIVAEWSWTDRAERWLGVGLAGVWVVAA